MSRWRFVGVLLGTAGLVAACNGGGGTAGGESSSSGGAGPIDSFIAQYCDLHQPCCAKAGKAYDQAKCRAFFTAFTAEATYDPGKGQQCLDAARTEASGGAFCETGLSDAADATCKGVFTAGPSGGTKKPGEPCELDSECASSAEGERNCGSSYANGATTRQCQILVRGKEGEDCVGEKTETTTSVSGSLDGPPPERAVLCYIADGLFCDSKTKKCSKIQDVGGPCDSFSSRACVEAAFCDTTEKKCVARKGAGEECTGIGDQCAEKHYCDTETKKCAPTIAAGQPCTKSVQCEGGSCTNGKCSGGGGAMIAFVCAQ